MTNREIAAVLEQFANLALIAGENPYRARAFQRAAETLRELEEPVVNLVADDRLRSVPGIGSGIADAVEALVRTGVLPPLAALQKTIPITLLDLLQVPGVGVKTISRLYHELDVVDLTTLGAAAESGRVRQLPGLGPKTEANILSALATLHRRTGRFLLGAALPIARQLVADLQRMLSPGTTVAVAGSVRRMEETVADIDLVVGTREPGRARDTIGSLPETSQFQELGPAAFRFSLPHGIPVDVALVEPSSLGTALIRHTGSASHLDLLPQLLPVATSEEAVYGALGMAWIPPELRQGLDEVAQALTGMFPRLITVPDIVGEFHAHTLWSDGTASVLDMVRSAGSRGYKFLGVSDHSRGLGVANGLDASRLLAQRCEIEAAERATGLRVFASSEVEVHRDGSLDFDEQTLATLDVVIASTHSGLRQSRESLTARLLKVIEHPAVDIIAHPSGRLIERREGGDFDWDRVFAAAAAHDTLLEINASPERLDLDATLARQALDAGCRLTINCDAHSPNGFAAMEYGVAVARRAGATPDQVVNAWSLDRIEDWLQNRRP